MPYRSTLEGAARQELIERCLQETDRLYRAHHHGKLLLVTSDSVSFLETISSRFNYVRIIPGKVVHMDFSTNEPPGTRCTGAVLANELHALATFPTKK